MRRPCPSGVPKTWTYLARPSRPHYLQTFFELSLLHIKPYTLVIRVIGRYNLNWLDVIRAKSLIEIGESVPYGFVIRVIKKRLTEHLNRELDYRR